jgi:hypothetical protein
MNKNTFAAPPLWPLTFRFTFFIAAASVCKPNGACAALAPFPPALALSAVAVLAEWGRYSGFRVIECVLIDTILDFFS